MFGTRVPLKPLAVALRSLSTMLKSGVAITKAFDTVAGKTTNPGVRSVLQTIAEGIRNGEAVADGLEKERDRVPTLMVEMVAVAEETGTLPEILRSLSDHFENTVKLRRTFYSAIAWPAFQYGMAVLVIAGMLFVLGWISQANGGDSPDVLGLGLTGSSGAITWILINVGIVSGLIFTVRMIRSTVAGQRSLDPLIMKIPVVGRCLQDFALARFSWAFALTQQTGMSVLRSLELALNATDNGAYIGEIPMIVSLVSQGDPLSTALSLSDCFPGDYVSMVSTGEEGGTVPETLERLSPEFEENARRSMTRLVNFAGGVIWFITAGFIIFLVLRIVLWYVGMLNDAVNQAL